MHTNQITTYLSIFPQCAGESCLKDISPQALRQDPGFKKSHYSASYSYITQKYFLIRLWSLKTVFAEMAAIAMKIATKMSHYLVKTSVISEKNSPVRQLSVAFCGNGSHFSRSLFQTSELIFFTLMRFFEALPYNSTVKQLWCSIHRRTVLLYTYIVHY